MRTVGPEPLLSAPLMTLGKELYPERWREDLGSCRIILTRTLVYLGLAGEAPELLGVDESSTERPPQLAHKENLPAWFLGWDGATPRFAVDLSALLKPAVLFPALVRACIHAMAVRRTWLSPAEHHSPKLDLIGLAFGWGVVLTHASHVIVSRSGHAKYIQLTALAPPAMATSLAWLSLARQLSPRDCREVARQLAPNQREAYEKALKASRSEEIELPEFLNSLPPVAQWPAVWDIQSRVQAAKARVKALAPMPKKSEEQGPERGVLGKNQGKGVFLVRRSLAMRIMKFGLGGVFLSSMLLRSDPSCEVDSAQVMSIGLAVVLLGGLIGRFIVERRCSDPKCDARLNEDMKECPRCGGTIAGIISNPKDRLNAAEELLDEEQAQKEEAALAQSGS